MITCICKNVSESELRSIIQLHQVRTIDELQLHTDAGTRCQTCHEELIILLETATFETNDDTMNLDQKS